MPGSIRLGTQGWNYDAWVGPFYPEGTKPSDFLGVYSRAFDSVEVDNEVVINTTKRLQIGEFVNVKITKAYDYDLEGEVVEEGIIEKIKQLF